jgi:L-cysteine desulfidase
MTAIKENHTNDQWHIAAQNQVVTLQDLINFKNEIILEVKKSIKQNTGQSTKKWLKTKEVQGILGVSITTLLTLRINGILPFTKMGGILYYDYDDIQTVMQKLKSNYSFLEGEKHRYKNDQ